MNRHLYKVEQLQLEKLQLRKHYCRAPSSLGPHVG